MIRSKTLILIFIPAIIIACFALFIRIIQYQPLYPKVSGQQKQNGSKNFNIPIYPEDPIIGNKKAGKTIIAFEDFACEGCKIQFTLLEQLLSKYPNNVKVVWKGLPVSKFPHPSETAHKYAFCVSEQDKFDKFQKLAFTNSTNLSTDVLDIIVSKLDIKDSKFKSCLGSENAEILIQKTEQLGLLLNIQSVPTFFVDNKQIEIPTTLEGWETLLNL